MRPPGLRIRFVCLSDLHLGALNSLLVRRRADAFEADLRAPSDVMVALAGCLRAVAGANPPGPRPTLVLVGDVLDLALASVVTSVTVFDHFVELTMPDGGELFERTIHFVPGNHDHHLWETARERSYAEYVRRSPPGSRLAPPSHVTSLFPPAGGGEVHGQLLASLLHRRAHLAGARVVTSYPNLGLRSRTGDRVAVAHHGHFVEGMYRLMSIVDHAVFPDGPEPDDVERWEADNAAWIDFFWSTLGRSGRAGADVGLLYALLQDERALARLIDHLALPAADGDGEHAHHRRMEVWALRRVLERVVARVEARERRHTATALSAAAAQGVRRYLEGPVATQVAGAGGTGTRGPVFVMGHTHKPFEERWSVQGLGEVDILNTGGWVVEATTVEPVQGAAAVLLDEDLNAVSLRLYQQAPTAAAYAVRVERVGDDPGTAALHDHVASLVDPRRDPWLAMSQAAAAGVERHCSDLATIIARRIPTGEEA